MATIAEKSRTKEVIDRLQSILNNASPVPLAAGKVTIYKDEVQSLLDELATQIDIELKTYHEVNDRRGKIIGEAKKEAEKIIYQAEHTASRMRVNKRSTGVAPVDYDALDEESVSALGNANEIYAASLIYTDEMLTEVTQMISDAYHNIRSDYEIILQVMEEKLNTIQSNRNELMEELQEMDRDDRSQQILEIGELLSNELYNSRMKARMDSDEYEDGSVQLSLDLKEIQAQQEEKTRQAEEMAQRAAQALAEMTAQRDELAQTVEKMKRQGMSQAIQSIRAERSAVTPTTTPTFVRPLEKQAAATTEAAVKETVTPVAEDEDIEYEYVYVTEDELEEGEEYEIEYVDDYEEEMPETATQTIAPKTETAEPIQKPETEEKAEDTEAKPQDAEVVKKPQGTEAAQKPETEEKEEDAGVKPQDAEVVKKPQGTEAAQKPETEEKEEDAGAKPQDTEAAEKRSAAAVQDTETIGEKEALRREINREELDEALRDLAELDKETEGIPIIPHFKKSQKIVSVASEEIADMANAMQTDRKYSGMLQRAAGTEPEKKPASEKQVEQDADIRKDPDGSEYVQATMRFDEDFEIMDF